MLSKGRANGPRGDFHPSAKLDSERVRELRSLYGAGVSSSTLAEQFGITRHQVLRVARRIDWKDVA